MPGYTYPGTDTLKNKLGAKTLDELEKQEARFVADRIYKVEIGEGPSGQFDTAHLKALHHFLFQDVFEWAGHTRDERVRLSDGTTATEPMMQKLGGTSFRPGEQIPAALIQVANNIRTAGYLRGLPQEQFAERAADVMSEINAVHAFREGNGRTQRTFMRELAKQAGHDLDFSVISGERMIQASIAAMDDGDPGVMRRLFKDAVIPERRAALAQAISALDAAGVSWNDEYIAAAEPGYPVVLALADIAGDQFRGDTPDALIIIGRTADLPAPTPSRGEVFTLKPRAWLSPG
jgi:cell filamentation protein